MGGFTDWPAGSLGLREGVALAAAKQAVSRGTPAPHDDYWYEPVAAPTSSGVRVTPSLALKCSVVYACVRVLAETVATMPLKVYRRTGMNTRELARDHYLYPILHDEPNPEVSAFQFWETCMMHLGYRGDFIAFKERKRNGELRALWPFDPDEISAERLDGRQIVYHHRPHRIGEKPQDYDPDEIFHIRGLSSDGLNGLSPIQAGAESIALDVSLLGYGARFFGGDGRPSIVLERPIEAPVLQAEGKKNLEETWAEKYGRSYQRSHKVGVLQEGTKAHVISISPEDAQALDSRRFQVEDIARFFRMQLHKIGHLDRSIKSNIEQQAIEFITDTIMPWLMRIAAEVQRSLFLPSDRGTYYAEHLIENYLRGDTKTRGEWYAKGRQWGWFSINDIRRLENMPGVPGGDDYLMPANMVPINATPPSSGGTS